MVDQTLHWIVAHRARGDEALFAGVPMAPGVHLRWSIRADLGFPKYGFLIERCFTEFCEFSTSGRRWAPPWVRVAHVAVPTLDERGRPASDPVEEATRRLTAHPDGARVAERYRREVPRLIDVLGSAVRPESVSSLGGDNIKFRSPGLLAIAALDPFIARMMGLYWIDGTVAPDVPVAYRVTALWDGTGTAAHDLHEWPWQSVDFTRANSREIGAGTIVCGGTTLRSMRRLVLFRAGSPRLELTGTSELALMLELPTAVRVVRLTIAAGADAGTWSAIVRHRGSRADSALVNSTVVAASGVVTIRGDAPFDSIELRRTGPGLTTWSLSALSWREREGSVGRVEAYCTVGNGPANPSTGPCADPPELSREGTVSRFADGHVLAPPTQVRLEQRVMPPIILDDGTVPTTSSHVAVFCRVGAGDPRRAVRLEARRTRPGTTPRLDLPHLLPHLDLPFPIPRFPALVPGRFTLPRDLLQPQLVSLLQTESWRFTFERDLKDSRSLIEARTAGKVTRRPRASAELAHIAFDEGAVEVALPRVATAQPFEVFAWVRAARPGGDQTIVASEREDIWLGLVGPAATPTLRVGDIELRAPKELHVADSWRLVGFSIVDSQVRLWIDGKVAGEAKLARATATPSTIRLGALARSKYLRGSLADLLVRLGRPTPPPAGLITPHPVIYRDDSANLPQLTDAWVPDGVHHWAVRGIDLFGRVSEFTPPQSLRVVDREPPPAPLAVEAALVPLTGAIADVRTVDAATWLDTDLVIDATEAAALPRHAVRVQREIDGRGWAELLEIVAADVGGDGRLRLSVAGPGVLRFRPRRSDAIRIEIDRMVELRWTWTGRQAFFHPRAHEHRVYRDDRVLNVLEAEVDSVESVDEAVWDLALGLDGAVAASDLEPVVEIGGRLYQTEAPGRVDGTTLRLRLRYLARPPVAPGQRERVLLRVRKDTPRWRDLREVAAWRDRVATRELAGHDPVEWPSARSAPLAKDEAALSAIGAPWLVKVDGGLQTITMPVTRAAGTPGPVSGAVRVRLDGRWVVLDVLHAQPRTTDTLLVLLVPADLADATHALELRDLRYVPGQRYVARLPIDPRIADEYGTAPIRFGVTTVDARGNESAVSRPARVIAVDRRLPRPAPQPTARFGRIDYHGVATARVEWVALSEPCKYQVYRATDEALFLRDCELRRKRRGQYAVSLVPDERDVVLRDDPEFSEWLHARFPDLATTWRTVLFADERSDVDAWKQANVVWRAFSERYHRALTPAQIAEHASREGMEACFGLVTPVPIDGTAHADPVPAGGTNAFLYRLRCSTKAQAHGLSLGLASLPAVPQSVRRPALPTITGAHSGDRRVHLRWSVQAASDVRRYDVYRADSAMPLRDLRWADTDPAVRRVASIEDPRLVARDRAVVLPPSFAITSIVGIHRADEHDRLREPDDQPRAFNYATATTRVVASAAAVRIENLRPIADGVAVVVVARDADGTIRRFDRAARQPLVVAAGDDHVAFSPTHGVATLLGIFERTTFDSTRRPIEDQSAENLLLADTSVSVDDSRTRIGPLATTEHHRELAVVYRDPAGRVRALAADECWPIEATHVDTGLVAFRDYFYAVVAIDRDGVPSPPSLAVQARAVDRQPPAPPRWEAATWIPSEPRIALAWSVEHEGARCLLMRRTRPDERFRPISPWLSTPAVGSGRWQFEFEDRAADPATGHTYGVMVVSASGNRSVELDPRTVEPR